MTTEMLESGGIESKPDPFADRVSGPQYGANDSRGRAPESPQNTIVRSPEAHGLCQKHLGYPALGYRGGWAR